MKKTFIGLFLVAGIVAFSLISQANVLAHRGTLNNQCLDHDISNFPFGYLCGGDPESTGWDNGNGGFYPNETNPAPSNLGGGTYTSGQIVNLDGGWNRTNASPWKVNGADAEVLVWITLDGDRGLVDNTNVVVTGNPGGTNGQTNLSCPVVSPGDKDWNGVSPSRPGPVFGYRDIGGSYWSNEQNGPVGSPNAFNPNAANGNAGWGDVYCGEHGKMVYWTNAVPSRDYRIQLRTPADRSGTICARMNISARWSTDVKYFPDSTSTWNPHQQNVVAAHLMKQGERLCYNFQVGANDYPPQANLSMDCDVMRVRGLYDANGSAVPYSLAYWSKADVDGSRGIYPSDFSRMRFVELDKRDGGVGDKNYGLPEDLNNRGWYSQISYKNIRPDGGIDNQPIYYKVAEVGTCYSATCSIDLVENVPTESNPQAGPEAVVGGKAFKVRITFNNTGAGTLRTSLGGNTLTATSWGNWQAQRPFGQEVPVGQSRTTEYWLDAPNDINSRTLATYPDYYGRFAIGPTCAHTITTYKPYQLTPSSNVVSAYPDPENPDSITYRSAVNREVGNSAEFGTTWYTGDINARAARMLYFAPRETGVRQAPDFHSEVHEQNYGTTTATWESTWTDELRDERRFKRANVIDTWELGDRYCADLTIERGKGWVGPNGPILQTTISNNPDDCDMVENRPYVRMYGGDPVAGGSFRGGSNSVGEIRTYLRGASASAGSGTEFAALALGSIRGFATANMRDSNPTAPNGLTLSNSQNILSSADLINLDSNRILGGNFGTSRQVLDWFIDTRRPGELVTDNNLSNRTVRSYGNNLQTLISTDGSTLQLNGHPQYDGRRTLYIDGDVVIKSSIRYKTDNWTNISEIPSLSIIVKGNIYIENDVDQLDGLFIAQPKDVGGGKNNDPNSGRIFTCTKDGGALANETELHALCNSQLKVNGSFIAQEVKYLRTGGTLSDVDPTVRSVVGTPEQPGYKFYWSNNGAMSGKHCTRIYEPAGPDAGGNGWDNNYLCSDQNLGMTYDYAWWRPAPDGARPDQDNGPLGTGPRCTYWDNMNEPQNHYWGDNYTCVADQYKDANIRFSNTNLSGPGVECISITEPRERTWGIPYFCYRPTLSAVLDAPAQFEKEPFGTTKAAEAFRLTPEFYLAQPVFRSGGSKYDYIITLPPIL